MVSCGNNQAHVAAETARQLERYKDSIRLAADTAGLAEFRSFKAQNELMSNPQYQDMQYAAAAAAPIARSYAPARRTTSRSYASAPRRSYSSRSSSGGGYSNSTASYPAKRKRWSKAAKGAVIGGVGGGVAGAVINKKNRAVGAVVGGILGAGGGYVIGRGMDKRDGRY